MRLRLGLWIYAYVGARLSNRNNAATEIEAESVQQYIFEP